MKRKLSVLLMGAVMTAAPFISNATLPLGQRITVNGFNYIVSVEPDPTDPDEIEELEDLAVIFVRANRSLFQGGLPRNVGGDSYTLQFDAPFDLGLSALLGAGVLAARKRARNRRQNAVVA